MDKIDIIQRIGYIRTRAKMTQKALSNAIGMNPSYINRLESAQNFLPSLEVLLTIIDVCGSTPEEFFYHDISAYERDKTFADKINSLPSDIKEFILDYDPDLMNLFTTINRKFVKIDRN
ncbi:MAG: helix-turn-helix transcriptional regulator [Clostridiales bacterium]|nr:helix-turn-helix transcriptional regulator [Clostridiales bacterium]